MRIQRDFHPLLVADKAYWADNHLSNAAAAWPVTAPAIAHDTDVMRTLVVFNDTFSGTAVNVSWEVHSDSPSGALGAKGTLPLTVALGGQVTRAITVHTPATGAKFYLVLRAEKNGTAPFEETGEWFTLN